MVLHGRNSNPLYKFSSLVVCKFHVSILSPNIPPSSGSDWTLNVHLYFQDDIDISDFLKRIRESHQESRVHSADQEAKMELQNIWKKLQEIEAENDRFNCDSFDKYLTHVF